MTRIKKTYDQRSYFKSYMEKVGTTGKGGAIHSLSPITESSVHTLLTFLPGQGRQPRDTVKFQMLALVNGRHRHVQTRSGPVRQHGS